MGIDFKIDSFLKTIKEEWEYTPLSSIVIFYIGLFFTALIVDKTLLYTYPSLILLVVVISLTHIAIRINNNYHRKKNYEKFYKNK